MANLFRHPTKRSLIIGLIVILLFHLPYFYYGEDSHIRIHDNLDSNVSWVKVLIDNNALFSSPEAPIEQIFDGLPRFALYGSYDIGLLWFYLFGMFWGYIANKLIMSFVAFFGMYLLLKKHVLPINTPEYIPLATGILFSFLPFWSFTLSVCGLPLAAYVFMNIRAGDYKWYNWIIVAIIAFYTSLVLSGIFLIFILGCIWLYDLYRDRKMNLKFLMSIILISILYVISHYPLIYSFFFIDDFVSHRTSFEPRYWSFEDAFDQFDTILRHGQFHAYSYQTHMILPILAAGIVGWIKKYNMRFYLLAVIFILLSSLLYGFIRWEAISSFYRSITDLAPIQYQRFYFFQPMLWYILLGLALSILIKTGKFGRIIALALIIFQTGYLLSKHEFYKLKNEPTFRQFYSEKLLRQVKEHIGLPQEEYRVISVGLHPAISHHNGFYALDGYFPNYPLEYKLEFRKVISGELDKDRYLKFYFDSWGSRCYAFTHTTRIDYLNPNHPTIEDLDFNFKALNNMGGEFLISSTPIDVNKITQLEFIKTFDHPESTWNVYLYKNKSSN